METLDPALLRPGRVDRILTWQRLSAPSVCAFVANFYGVAVDALPAWASSALHHTYTAAELHAHCGRYRSWLELAEALQWPTLPAMSAAPVSVVNSTATASASSATATVTATASIATDSSAVPLTIPVLAPAPKGRSVRSSRCGNTRFLPTVTRRRVGLPFTNVNTTTTTTTTIKEQQQSVSVVAAVESAAANTSAAVFTYKVPAAMF